MAITINDVKVFKVTNQKNKVFLVLGASENEVEKFVENERCQFDCFVHKDFKVEENTDEDIYFHVDDLNTDCFSMNCDWSKFTYKANTLSIENNMSNLIAQYHDGKSA